MIQKAKLIAFALIASAAACASIPEGQTGPEAQKLAERMLNAAGYQTWQKQTVAVSFRFREKNRYFWDRKRDLVEFQTDEILVLFNKNTFAFKAYEKAKSPVLLSDEEAKDAFTQAYSAFTNDVFWLQPLYHISSPGTEWSVVEEGGALRVTFSSGGVTPGDTYVFVPDADYRIQEMKMWVSILPVKGIGADFSDYHTTTPGIAIAKSRTIGFLSIPLDEIELFTEMPANSIAGSADDRFSALVSGN